MYLILKMVKINTCVFISGQGLTRNLIFHSRNENFPIKISLVICDNRKAYGINYAKKFKILHFINKTNNYENKIFIILKNTVFPLYVLLFT